MPISMVPIMMPIFNFYNIVQILSLPTLAALWLSKCTDEKWFLHLFICYTTSASGFAYCCLILSLNKAHLKGKYLDILLSITTTDVNSSLFPCSHLELALCLDQFSILDRYRY